jgi:hypothetical protein
MAAPTMVVVGTTTAVRIAVMRPRLQQRGTRRNANPLAPRIQISLV